MKGPVIFTDAADATSSGASGDSNAIIAALKDAGYEGRVLAQIVDPAAAAAAHAAGVGANIEVTLGGAIDPGRYTPMPVKAHVRLLSDGKARLETMKMPLDAGPSAVLTFDNFTVVVLSRSVSLFDRAMYYSNGCNPMDYDLIVVKSPHTEHHMFEAWAEKNFNIDAPGATSADLKSLGHTICARPMYPMDADATFAPQAAIYWAA
jgi:microcystin degradation protein MlrC